MLKPKKTPKRFKHRAKAGVKIDCLFSDLKREICRTPSRFADISKCGSETASPDSFNKLDIVNKVFGFGKSLCH